MALGTEIKAEMTRRKMKLDVLAQTLGVTRNTASKKINGHSDWTYTELQKVSDLFGVSMSELVKRAENAPSITAA